MKAKHNLMLFACLLSAGNLFSQLTSAALGKMEARSIGPAVIGGRITAIEGVNDDPRIVYVGTGGGGVWKTTNGGSQFKPVFDKHCQSIGAIAINQKKPDEVWVGTGESNMRNSVSVGDGIYKSIDGGENWINMGLKNSEHISEIAISPTDANTLYVAVPGKLWSDSPDRGLYKTTDGGISWNKILYVNERTGCADIEIDPRNPEVIYATTWEFRRTPYSFSSGGKGSGIFKSSDGGKTWSKVQEGIPSGDLGRIALALSPVKPDRLAAIVESSKTGLYITENGGADWAAQSADDNITARPFYFSTIEFDLEDANRVYRPAFTFSFSNDGGYSWSGAQNASGWVHVDMHALWIDPKNTSHMYVGTDGGLYMSVDKGNNWLYLNNMPIGQAYHAQIDKAEPYNVYSGYQDNGSWMAPSQSIGGIENGDWKNIGGGDGFWVQTLPADNNIVFSEYQGGHVQRLNVETNQSQDVQPKAASEKPEDKLRFNWNTPIQISPNNPNRIYMGAQFLFSSIDGGISWQKISGDLTTNDTNKTRQDKSGGVTVDNTSAENHCTIFTISESPLDANMIWVGTDDGNLQLTTDGGNTWKNLAANYTACGIPAYACISSIEPGRFDKNTVYITVDNHGYGDMKTYMAVSNDMGKTWTRMLSGTLKGYAHKIKEDLVDKNLLFAGTEWGLYMSTDAGKNWLQMKGKVPEYVAVRDLQIDKTTSDLILATHGRSILIIDDIAPLRSFNTKNYASRDVSFIANSKATPITIGHYGQGWPNAGGFIGPNSTEEAVITYYLKNRLSNGDVSVRIYDANNQMVAEIPGTKRKGFNRITWNMRSFPPRVAEGGAQADWASTVGPLVSPGSFTVKISAGDLPEASGTLQLISDSKSGFSEDEMKQTYNAVRKVMSLHARLADFMQVVLTQKEFAFNQGDASNPISKVSSAYYVALENLRSKMVPVQEGTAITGEEKIRDHISDLYWGLNFYQGKPTQSQLDKIESISKELDNIETELNDTVKKYLPQLLPTKVVTSYKDLLMP